MNLILVWPILIFIFSYLSTKGIDGNLVLFIFSFSFIGIGYLIHSLYAHSSLTKLHYFSPIIFTFFSVVPFPLGSHLDEMAGMLYVFIPISAVTISILGLIGISIKQRHFSI